MFSNSVSPISLQTPRRQSRLFCRYYDNHRNPMYLLGPVKQEDEWDRPYIVRYHDIISHSEIEKVKELAKPRVSISPSSVCVCCSWVYIVLKPC